MKTEIPEGYKNSPVGIIPEEWEVKRLEEIAEITSGATPSRKMADNWNGNIPWVTTSLLNNARILSAEEYITQTGLYNSATKILPPNTVLMAMYGQGQTRGKVSILRIEAATNQACAALIMHNGTRFDYIFYQLSNMYDIIRNLSNDGSQKNLNLQLIKNIEIVLPHLPEQQKIAEILSMWDVAIEKQTLLIEKLELRKRGLMQQLLTGKKRLKGFDGEWRKVCYSEIVKEINSKLKWNDEELYKLVSVRRRSGGLFERESLYGKEIQTKNLRPIITGDFLISKMQIVHGASGLVTEEFNDMKISGSYVILNSKNKNILDMCYFNLWSQMPHFYHQAFISSYGVHIEKMTFSLDTFLSFGMTLPPIKEQKAIIKVISVVDKEIHVAKEKLEQLNKQKKGLMQVLLTGKKRVITTTNTQTNENI
ncbi:MAG: restriction endonuclease subunit S [Candidatus Pacebacteria bacterium]|nr:restriction endonuclease subunit S [Candidatus Paceibacterota bacterium]